MHRLARIPLEMMIGVAMKTAPKLIRQRMKSREPDEADRAHREFVTHICDQIDNDSYMVIAADVVGAGTAQCRGKWGVDEPMPATVPTFPGPSNDHGQQDDQAGGAKD